jgi:hypothetical protein
MIKTNNDNLIVRGQKTHSEHIATATDTLNQGF